MYHMPVLYGTVEYIYIYIYSLPCTMAQPSAIQDVRKEPMPSRGCSGRFRVLIKQFSGITRGDLYVIENPGHTRAVDGL